jgi:hypothetical protein
VRERERDEIELERYCESSESWYVTVPVDAMAGSIHEGCSSRGVASVRVREVEVVVPGSQVGAEAERDLPTKSQRVLRYPRRPHHDKSSMMALKRI